MISEYTILSYIAQAQTRGWGLMRQGSLADGWHAVYQGRLRNYDVFLDVDEEWLYMQCPLLKLEPALECKRILYEYLLRANDQMFFAKFTLFQGPIERRSVGWITLTTECPVDSCNAGMFRLMTDAIATYAEQFGREIPAIALDPEIAMRVESAGWTESASA